MKALVTDDPRRRRRPSHVTHPKNENGQPTVAGMLGVVEVSEDGPASEIAAGPR